MSTTEKKFLYLVQTKDGLGKELQGLYGPQSDVIGLSWNKPAKDCIFFPFSSWTEGRNRLYQEALNKNYLYCIFIDGDAHLRIRREYNGNQKNPWRLFEEYLSQYEPAVGMPYFHWHKVCDQEVQTIASFDMIVNAVHRESMPVLLPYYDGWDKTSWWYSGVYFSRLAHMLYPKNTLQFNALETRGSSSQDIKTGNLKKIQGLSSAQYPTEKKMSKVYNDIAGFTLRENESKIFNLNSSNEVAKKRQSFFHSKAELARMFDTSARYWVRRYEIADAIATQRAYACTKTKLPYVAEKIKGSYGSGVVRMILWPFLLAARLERISYPVRRVLIKWIKFLFGMVEQVKKSMG